MVERQLPKLHTRVRFPSPAPVFAQPWPHQPSFRRRSRLYLGCRKTMALNLRADRGQTRGQYPAPPPWQLELKGLNLISAEIGFAARQDP